MHDLKFKLALWDDANEREMPLPAQTHLVLIKRSNEDAIPDDEPIFIFRARDYLALPALLHYYQLSLKDNCTEYHKEGMLAALARFVDWQTANPDKMKQPGVTRGIYYD